MSFTRVAIFVFALFLFLPLSLHGQEEQVSPPQNFSYLRVGTASSVFAFHTYETRTEIADGLLFGIGGIIADPHGGGYKEYLAGSGLNFTSESAGIGPFLVLSKASDAWYAEPSFFGHAQLGPLTFSSFFAGYVPLEHSGAFQLVLDPLQFTYELSNGVGLGGAYTFFAIEGASPEHGLGPAVELPLPWGSATVDYLIGIANKESELRTTLEIAF